MTLGWEDGVHLVWVDPDSGACVFLAGEADVTPESVKEHGVHLVLNVNAETRVPSDAQASMAPEYKWLPFYDAPPSEQDKGMKENAGRAVMDLVEAVRAGRNVLVHCRAGIHRSPAVVYAALVLLGRKRDRVEAFQHVVRVRNFVGLHSKLARWVEHAGRDEMRYRAEGKRD